MKSVFASKFDDAYPYRFKGQLTVERLVGGTPTDPKVAEGWLKSKLAVPDDIIREEVARVMVERAVSAEEAAKEVDITRHLTGFKRDPSRNGELFIEGRQLKAALKEAISVSVAADKIKGKGWGRTNKGILGYFAEHVFIPSTNLYLGVTQPTGVMQNFVHTWRGSGIKYEEYLDGAVINFEVIADHDFSNDEWATIWLCGEQQGIGASRSQGHGRYAVTQWDKIKK